MRRIVLDTETTGMPVGNGHRIIEVGCIELLDRTLSGRNLHFYLQPNRKVDPGALAVHGITDSFLKDKPYFHDIADELFQFIEGSELIIHNAKFDISFLNNEFSLAGQSARSDIAAHCSILDTLLLARSKHPGRRNNLDALSKRYGVDNSSRDLHGALLDAQILAEVYLAMTSGQTNLVLNNTPIQGSISKKNNLDKSRKITSFITKRKVTYANEKELALHEKHMQYISKSARKDALWFKYVEENKGKKI